MERAIEVLRARGGEDKRQIEQMLRERPWEEVGRFASYSCQDTALGLKPWMLPPCEIDDPDAELAVPGPDSHGRKAAASLLQELLAHGLSKFEPDPIRALAEARRRSK
jgi:hypothetical protein